MNSAQDSHEEIRKSTIVDQLHALGVEHGGVLLVHSSFRAARPVEGGPSGLVEALLDAVGPGGTLVMPAWGDNDDEPFDSESTPVSPSLGIVPEMFRRMPGVLRSSHFFAFAAAGPAASKILADPLPLPPHRLESPVGRVFELDGQVLLLGVDHDANTILHLAELLAGVPYGVPKHCTVLRDGKRERVEYRENDHCCDGFRLVNQWLREENLQHEGPVGHAPSKLFRARDAVAVAKIRLATDPCVFLHPEDSACEECREARASVTS